LETIKNMIAHIRNYSASSPFASP